ncbi:MAG: arginine--tRNA ligase [Acidobacteria bacterium]|nr:arginine--tRNA ligase [Acidobacteriota bacterium]
MILPLHDELRAAIGDALARLYGLGPDRAPAIVLDLTPNRQLGDLATPVAFELARRLKKAPRLIAQELAAALAASQSVARVEPTHAGYINVFLDRPVFLRARLAGLPPRSSADLKTIVEHTAINPNKAAHIGHIRNAALGDTLVRVLRFRGTEVEVQNYIDNTGVQVADVVVGFQQLEQKHLDDVRALSERDRFDYHCWDLYARVTEWYEADRDRLRLRAAALHEIEHDVGETAAIGHLLADRIVRCHLRTMGRLNIEYDLLTWEGDILRLQFWAQAFELLKQTGAVFHQDKGRLAGCWVMPIEDGSTPTDDPEETAGTAGAEPGTTDDDADRLKVIVRSNGTVTYVGKDIAYQLWKFGLLGRDFFYRIFDRRIDGGPVWATTATPPADPLSPPRFGAAGTTYNVIDVRQSYLQKLLQQALRAMRHEREAERSIHFSYEMVALSHATARQLGYEIADADRERPFVEVSGRRGLGVKADDLLDVLVEKALAEVSKRNPEMDAREAGRVARMIAVAAVRYFMIKYSRGKVIAFDIEEALSFEGESGPYLQYAAVRAGSIFQKLQDREGLTETDVMGTLGRTDAAELTAGPDELWTLVLESSRLDEVVEQVVRTLEFSNLAKFAFGLAQLFNAFYHKYPILNEERRDTRLWRAAGVSYFRSQMTKTLELMGIRVPGRM